ncbi:MFS transporter [Undibacterium sp. FT79W]|uniref:MFS transporter n=1 Tax=Undibacterium sp. FT79W TaxID=2762296 RepID=UPI00164AF716|nr:MFS transporter [Undibacterium sp. FT79W]
MKAFSPPRLLAYGLFGFPLALLALPIYVYVPQFYAERFGMSLSLIGSALLVSRVLDAFLDLLLGAWIDKRPANQGYGRFILYSLPLLIPGFYALFHPPAATMVTPMLWFFCALLMVYAGFSLASIAFQSWGAALTQLPGERLRLTATRELCGVAGVVTAALLSQFADISWLSAVLICSLLIATFLLLRFTPDMVNRHQDQQSSLRWRHLFSNPYFRSLFLVFVLNGIAAAIPATLFLFFAKDRLQLASYSGVLLLLYFVAAAMSLPLWVRIAQRIHESRAWLLAMLLSVLSFIWAYSLQVGDLTAFAVICVLSGLCLGADLALPPALLSGVIRQAGHSERYEGSYFSAWNWANKMNLALAAGLSLPLLDYLGYTPGVSSGSGLQALSFAYAVLPCVLKGLAALVLWRAPLGKV